MKSRSEEEIQRMLDRHGLSTLPDDDDTKIYRRLYEALAAPPTLLLSENFADRVVEHTVRLQKRYHYRQEILMIILIATSLLMSAFAIYYTDATFFRRLTQWLLQIKEIIAFAITSLVLVQLGDRWLVKKAR